MNETIENNFKFHKLDAEKAMVYHEIRDRAKEFAYLIDNLCPDSREKSLAMTKIEEAVFWANAAVARNNGNQG